MVLALLAAAVVAIGLEAHELSHQVLLGEMIVDRSRASSTTWQFVREGLKVAMATLLLMVLMRHHQRWRGGLHVPRTGAWLLLLLPRW